MNNLEYLNQYYQDYDEDGRLLSRHGMVEFLTTMRYIDKYLRPNTRTLEIGAGTGRYSHLLASKGHTVDAIELVEHNIEVFKSKITAGEPITITQGDATNLQFLKDETYELTLLLGPMYHLFTKEEQEKALSEAIRVTKSGGVIFAAYCMGDASVLTYGFIRGHIHEIIDKCLLNTETFETFSNPWDIFKLYRKEDIDILREKHQVTQLHFVASDGYANHMREALASMSDETFALYLKYHFATCERQDMVGLSHHTLDIFRK